MTATGLAERSVVAWVPSQTDAVCDPDAALDELSRFPVSGATFGALLAVDERRLSETGRIDHLVVLRRHEAALAAARIRAIAAIDAATIGDEFGTVEVAPALNTTQAQATLRIRQARFCVDVIPASLAALARGEIDEAHLRQLVEQTWTRTDELARAVEARVLPGAGDLTPARFGRAVARALIELDPATAEQRHRAAAEQRRTGCRPVGDGMSLWWMLAPASYCAAAEAAVDAVAAKTAHAGDTRTADQRRADAAAQIFSSVLADPNLLKHQGQSPGVNVTVPAETLFGGDAPGELTGHGPITADQARQLAALADRWRLLLTDEHGRLIAMSSEAYRPPRAMRRFVITRDVYCSFPGCTARAERVDLDHIVEWPWGPTAPHNLHPLCRRHHRAKTRGVVHLVRDDSTGTTVWTTRTGHVWITRPPPHPRPTGPPLRR